jgi:hypothetical protein
MKSKAHHKKCVELGISPVPTTVDDSQNEVGMANGDQVSGQFYYNYFRQSSAEKFCVFFFKTNIMIIF